MSLSPTIDLLTYSLIDLFTSLHQLKIGANGRAVLSVKLVFAVNQQHTYYAGFYQGQTFFTFDLISTIPSENDASGRSCLSNDASIGRW